MKNVRTHITQFTQFFIRQHFYALGAVYESGIARKETRNVRPVFIESRTQCARHYCARNIRTAARKSFNFAVRSPAVKTGEHGKFFACRRRRYGFICFLIVKKTVLVKEYNFFCINKFCAQNFRHYACGKILAAGSGEITAALFFNTPAREF